MTAISSVTELFQTIYTDDRKFHFENDLFILTHSDSDSRYLHGFNWIGPLKRIADYFVHTSFDATCNDLAKSEERKSITFECISWIFLVSKYDQSILFLFIVSPRFIPFKTTRFYCYYFVCVPLSTDYSAMIYKQTHLFIRRKKGNTILVRVPFLLFLSLFSEVQLGSRESVKYLSDRTYTIYVGTESESHNITSLRFPNKSFFLRSFIVCLPAFQHWEMILISVVVVVFTYL